MNNPYNVSAVVTSALAGQTTLLIKCVDALKPKEPTMNCRTCNTPAAPCELVQHESDGKGQCIRCLERERNKLNAALCRVMEIIDSGDNLSNDAFYGTEHGWWRAMINTSLPNPFLLEQRP